MSRGVRTAPRLVRAVASAIILATALAGCSNDPLAEQYKSGSGNNYIAGDGSVTEIAPENRGAAVDFSGTTETGDTVTSAQYRGNVLVVNFWYAACAPCRVEAPDLQKLADEFAPESVSFLGVNLRDSAETALAFSRNFGVSYPSVIDGLDRKGGLLLAFTGYVSPNTVPTTLVVDRQGRVSARISGRIEPGTLRSLIETANAEDE